MRVVFAKRFRERYNTAPPHIRKRFDKQLPLLLRDYRHPSLDAKKYDERRGIFQARVSRDWRFYYRV